MKRLSYPSLVFLIFLVGCMPTTCNCGEPGSGGLAPVGVRPNNTQLDPASLVSANTGQPLIVKERGNCPVDEVEIPGEGFRVKGGIGGLAIAHNPVGSALEIGQNIYDIAAPDPSETVVMIVLDDFNGTTEQPGVYYPDQGEGSRLSDLQAGATAAEVAALEANRQYSHGALVFNHTLSLLRSQDPEPTFSEFSVTLPDEDLTLTLPAVSFPKIGVAVLALDTEDFNTDIIAGRLQATLEALRGVQGQRQTLAAQQVQRLRRFVVNMSFGLVPCSVLADIEAAQQADMTFEDYAQDVLDANGLDANAFRDDLVNLLTTTVGSDPLLYAAASSDLNAGEEVVYIAAAGNYSLPFSLFPGYWSEFVSVSAKNLARAEAVRDPDYSNTGEVLLDGGYFRLSAYEPATNTWRDYPNISVAGTSFAAPVLSAFTALDLTNTTPRCGRKAGNIASPLAFFKTDPPVIQPLPAMDITLETALTTYCMLE